jgi:hypothetical protein
MPIEEKPQLLEFNCTIEGMDDVSWNIKYDPNDKIGLQISGNGQTFHCPVELFGDVTAFLQGKNIIKPNVLTRSMTAPTPAFEPGSYPLLTPPKVEGQTDTSVNKVVISGPPMDALASFDITAGASDLKPPTVNNAEVKSATIEPSHVQAKPNEGAVVTSKTKSEIINRTVIRTRVNKDDPMSAEREAAEIRGTGAAGAKKTIKKKHQIAE